MKKTYFPAQPDAPSPLTIRTERGVRFEEVDCMGIVWHGRYPSYFEDARVALGAAYKIGYMDLYDNGILTPIKSMQIDYHHWLRFQETITIEARLHFTEAARINYEFLIFNAEGRLTTTGCSVQLMLDADRNLLITPPDWYVAFLKRWRDGDIDSASSSTTTAS